MCRSRKSANPVSNKRRSVTNRRWEDAWVRVRKVHSCSTKERPWRAAAERDDQSCSVILKSDPPGLV